MNGLPALVARVESGTYRRITSVLVEQRGELVHETYHDEHGADVLRNTRSVTKTVAGLLVGIAIGRGELPGVEAHLLDLVADLAPFVDDGAAKRAITVADLLTMTSALDCDDTDPASPGNEERMYPTDDWLRFAVDVPARAAGRDGRFRYCTAGVMALAGILERATGRPVPEYAKEHLFGPMGIVEARWTRSPSGLAMTGGGLELRSRDFLALGRLVLADGRHDGRPVVPSEWMRASVTPHVSIGLDVAYGYLWWLRRLTSGGRAYRTVSMEGNGGNKVAVFPELDAVVVITSTNFGTAGMHEQTTRILTDEILPALT